MSTIDRIRIEVRVLPERLRRLKEPVAALPLLLAKELVYDDRYFATMEILQKRAYEALARRLQESLLPRSAIDLGCGSGALLAELAKRGVDVRGVEGSRAAIRRSPVADRIVRANLEKPMPSLGRFDLAICLEVAEHLPRRAAPVLVASLASLSDRVLFSAAPPGQGGTHHVNEQPVGYWLELFARHGLSPDDTLGADLRGTLVAADAPRYLSSNVLFLTT